MLRGKQKEKKRWADGTCSNILCSQLYTFKKSIFHHLKPLMIEILHRPGFLSALTHISSHYSQLCTSAVHTKKQINLMNIQYLPMRISS